MLAVLPNVADREGTKGGREQGSKGTEAGFHAVAKEINFATVIMLVIMCARSVQPNIRGRQNVCEHIHMQSGV